MKIIHVTDAFAPVMGGIETQVAQLASQQAMRGDRVTVLTTTPSDPRKGSGFTGSKDLSFDPADADIPYQVVRSEWHNPTGYPIDPRAPKRFLQLIEEQCPDVVHVHLGELTPVATEVLRRMIEGNIPTVATVHSIWSGFPTVPLFRSGAHLAGLYDAPVIWLPNSELTAGGVRKVVDPKLVRVQNNSVDADGWNVPEVVHQGLVAVTATRFAPRKRVPDLLEILRDAGRELEIDAKKPGDAQPSTNLRAVIAGEGPGLESARKYVASQGMEGWVSLPGRMTKEQLVEQYARSDIYISPSVKDAFSISGLEARAAGLAILARSQSGFGAAVEDGVEGRAVKTDREMTEVLVQWAQDPSLVESFKTHNRETPMPYTWDNAIPQFRKHYQDAARLRSR